jgi:DNA-directed RNA polymerase subunit RPC12/RpoP
MTFNRTRCPNCKGKLLPKQRIHPECIDEWASKQEAKAARKAEREAKARAKVDRAQTRARRRALETIPDLIRAAQKEFNAYVRSRDKDQPCICCGKPLGSGEVGGGYDCGHFRSVGSASHLRFDERNAHAQRKQCNRWGAGRAVDYRCGLIDRIGLAAVEALEASNEPHKWTHEELRQIAATYRQKRKELEA